MVSYYDIRVRVRLGLSLRGLSLMAMLWLVGLASPSVELLPPLALVKPQARFRSM